MIRVLAFMLLTTAAHGQTLCPTVSNNISVIPVYLTGTPYPLDYSQYDLTTHYLTVAYMSKNNQMLVNVPINAIQGHATVPWVSVKNYPSAIMQEKSTCPLLTETGVPIWAQ